MEKLRINKTAYKGHFTRCSNSLKTELDKEVGEEAELDVAAIIKYKKSLQDKYEKLKDVSEKMQDILTDDDDVTKEIEELENIYDIYIELDTKASLTVERVKEEATLSKSQIIQNSTVTQVHRRFNLPEIKLKKFTGDYKEYQEFIDNFMSSIDKNEELEPCDKFTYLKSYLDGDAADLINGFSTTNANYKEAMKLLKDNFGREDLIITSHISRLLNIIPVKDNKDVKALRRLLNSIRTHLRSLAALKVNVDEHSIFIVPIIMSKLPLEMNAKWTRKREKPDIEKLLGMLQTDVEGYEAAIKVHDVFEITSPEAKTYTQNQRRRFTDTRIPTASALHVNTQKYCIVCKENSTHDTETCKKIQSMSVSERKAVCYEDFICFLCLKKNHLIKTCSRFGEIGCKKCNSSYHNTILHEDRRVIEKNQDDKDRKDKVIIEGEKTNVNKEDVRKVNTQATSTRTHESSQAMYQTAVAILKDDKGGEEKVRVVFDTCSDSSFVKKSKASLLNMTTRKELLSITGIGGKSGEANEYNIRSGRVVSRHDKRKFKDVQLIEIDQITKNICREPIPQHFLKHSYIKGLQLAENYEEENNDDIDILIGLDYYWEFITGRTRRQKNKPIVTESILGWIVQSIGSKSTNKDVNAMFCSTKQEEIQMNNEIKKMFDLESIGILPKEKMCYNRAEKLAIKQFNESASYNENEEKWSVGLPWAGDRSVNRNEEVALRRYYKLEQRFKKNPEFEEKYRSAMEEYIEAGYAEEVPEEEINSEKEDIYYLPHHAVIKEGRDSTKVRIVFDGSSHEENEECINDKLLTGPALQPLLVDILMRFRVHQVALNSDIKKMYLNIGINTENRDSLRFFWRTKGSKKIIHYRNTVLPFGISSSPFLAIATVREHLKRKPPENGLVAEVLINDMYMDDLLTGADSKEEAVDLYEGCKESMNSAGMELVKWKSNEVEVTNNFEKDEPKNQEKSIEHKSDIESKSGVEFKESHNEVKYLLQSPSHKILGVHWLKEKDEFTFKIDKIIEEASKVRVTKRKVASIAARLYDPLGWISPFIVKIKMLMTRLWEGGYEWDEEVSPELITYWKQWIEDVKYAEEVHIDRCYHKANSKVVSRILHIFGDASEEAYAAVAYMITEDEEGNCSSKLVMARTRVAPVKRVTLPRLELLAALLAARLGKYIQNALKSIKIDEIYYWTDSNIVLSWIQSKSKELKPFVGNRVEEIQDITEPTNWKKCPGESNPADIPSRGMGMKTLSTCKEWWEAPEWLKNKNQWPNVAREVPTEDEFKDEYRKGSCLVTNVINKSSVIPPENNSRWTKLMRVTARIKRLAYNIRNRNNKKHGMLTADELNEAYKYWIKQIQFEAFSEEIELLKDGKMLNKSSQIYDLNPYYDHNDGYLRLTGRIHRSQLNEETKHPILMPYNHHAVKLLILYHHNKEEHAESPHTLITLRNKYWIMKGKRQVNEVLNTCMTCKMSKPKPLSVMKATLPADRITPQPPFTVVGIDFTGPLYVYQGDECNKMYICLYTCAVIRAVHLELVWDLTTESFLRSFRRFISIRGLCRTIYTDNAKTFEKAHKDLMKSLNLFNSKEFKEYLGEQNIEWKFICPRAPWWGGFYESLMTSIKTPLKKVLKDSMLNVDEVNTILQEVSAMVNSRPLTYVSEDLSDIDYLTPAKFILGRQTVHLTLDDTGGGNKASAIELRRRRKLQNQYLTKLWNQWTVKYLAFTSVKNPNRPAPQISVGHLVLVLDHRVPKQVWKIGVITKVYPGKDGQIRSVEVKMKNGKFIQRSIAHISTLEVNEETTEDDRKIVSRVFKELSESATDQEASDFDNVDVRHICG